MPKMPGVFESADAAAVAAQQKFIAFLVADLVLLALAAILGALSPLDGRVKTDSPEVDLAALGTGLLLVGGLVLSVAARTGQFNKRWFAARAIAESVKTEAWRFMMRTPPHNVDNSAADGILKGKLKQILDAQPEAHIEMASSPSAEVWVSTEMSQVRALNVVERYTRYLTDRLSNQKQWYAENARKNRRTEGIWFGLGIGTHGVGVGLVFMALLKIVSLDWVGVLTTLAASFIAWTQLRDHQRLANSYGLILQELAMLEPSTPPTTEEGLSKLVEEVERTISREHTLWISRKL